jgi:two-component sensor histidine kinase
MGMLYDTLYRTADYAELSINEYLPSLVDDVIANFPNSRTVTVVKEIDDFVLATKQLQALGIIINELLTNIMKHAFQKRAGGQILVSAANIDGHVTIITQDSGKGIPASISFENSTGFGLQLVHALTKQLNGQICIDREHGTKVILEFDATAV